MEKLRFVTAASLFDGHDVSINIMRRILQQKGVEVVHLGHNRSVGELVDAAIQEDAHAVAVSSYQGGHNEYFSYLRESLDARGGKNIRIFGGGGGVITPDEINLLHKKGVTRIYSPQDGVELGLEGIISDMVSKATHSTLENFKELNCPKNTDHFSIGKIITYVEENGKVPFACAPREVPVLGFTGTGGAGKSSLIDELILRFQLLYPEIKIGLISIDPTRKKTGGALLGDRIRLGSVLGKNLFVRSLATRDSGGELSPYIKTVLTYLKSLDFNLIIVETSGIGQASHAITEVADKSIYVMTSEYGAPTQLEKIEMLDSADFVVLNKFERPRAEDALRDIRKQYRRNKNLFYEDDNSLPIYGTIASRFNDDGVNCLFGDLVTSIQSTTKFDLKKFEKLEKSKSSTKAKALIGSDRVTYLRDIAQSVRKYNSATNEVFINLQRYSSLMLAGEILGNSVVEQKIKDIKSSIPDDAFVLIDNYIKNIEVIKSGKFKYKVRDIEISVDTKYKSLSGTEISKVTYPKTNNLSELFLFLRNYNLPGFFPFSSGIFPFRRTDEDPKRMFAGEGGPIRTNKRFHYLSAQDAAKRLSTAFDSVTLYGEDPDLRPDIFGKIGEAGVSIATLDDMEDLYRGFDLTSSSTSVSMTINGPAPIILAMFMNTAIKQKLGEKEFWDKEKRFEILRKVRGTVQADILKEDQAQNTCIFSLDFALCMMGDIQEYFCRNKIKNYYSVSISGYHIAEAGANPISQVAFTLANGFTYVEYYLSRGMKIDEFAENLSYFFSNGLDPEYTVIGAVARKIWAVSLRDKYGASEKSQKLKYHIQTSGRSLHAQEIDFNDIRTTLQAFIALSDNCNSLHTNAYDEAITTPTEESVRRAMAIQLIINKEFGLNKTDNPLHGSFLYQELFELVEEAILSELERISDKGGVLGAMEVMYQRGKIQEESMIYEMQKDSGALPIIGVNTYLSEKSKNTNVLEIPISRCTDEEKKNQIARLNNFKNRNKNKKAEALDNLKKVAISGGNIFEELLTTVNYCSLGEITNLLFEVGGRYRRNM